MADLCDFRITVQGRKNACYAFWKTQYAEDAQIVKEYGREDAYVLLFAGCCKWDPDAYCKPYQGELPVDLPADFAQASTVAAQEFSGYTQQSRSEMFCVDVQCNSVSGPVQPGGVEGRYVHYKNGVELHDACPEELLIYPDNPVYFPPEDESESEGGEDETEEEFEEEYEEYEYDESAVDIDEDRLTELYRQLLSYVETNVFSGIPGKLEKDLKNAEKWCLTYHDPDCSHPLFFVVSYLMYVQEPHVDVENILQQLGATPEEIDEIMCGPIELYC